MTEQKMVTEAEAVQRERAAARHGFSSCNVDQLRLNGGTHGSYVQEQIDEAVAEKYPMPTITRPRVVSDNYGNEYRVVTAPFSRQDKIEIREKGHEWRHVLWLGSNRKALREILDEPNETVEVET